MILAVVDEQIKMATVYRVQRRTYLTRRYEPHTRANGRPKQKLAVDDARKAEEECDALALGMSTDELVALVLGDLQGNGAKDAAGIRC